MTHQVSSKFSTGLLKAPVPREETEVELLSLSPEDMLNITQAIPSVGQLTE